MTVAADGPAQNASEGGQGSGRPRSSETIYKICADPRSEPRPLPRFPNPKMRPEGAEPALVLEFVSAVPKGVDIAMGRTTTRDVKPYLRAIGDSGARSIICAINCAGGEGDSALTIANA